MKYALLGYTYQHYIACLLLALMDVERKIEQIALEVDADHKFDDIKIEAKGQKYFLQLKDIEGIKLDDLKVENSHVWIGNKAHRLSESINVIVFKKIKLKNNCRVLGFPACKIADIYLVSYSREQAEKQMDRLYRTDSHRRQVIQNFFAKKLDDRIIQIEKRQLPSITVFDTRLIEKNIRVARNILRFENILHIEGKPGVGKSHLVSLLQKQHSNNVLYRFWISSQDQQYENRLKFQNFLSDLNKKLFYDQYERSPHEILNKLSEEKLTLIIDGLDHVENYRPSDLENFIGFIDRAKDACKVIVLSRPLRKELVWKKQVLLNWNGSQTERILKELYHIEDYFVFQKIYKLTDGYPILVKYISEQFKREGAVPDFSSLATVNLYYEQLFKDATGKRALGLFLCSRGYLMKSEIKSFLGETAGEIVEEMIQERPYLFELRLNRIALYHDSLITFLRNTGININPLQENVNAIVFRSLISGERRFQSRLIHFDLPLDRVTAILQWYSSLHNFRMIMKGVIDFEAISEFYEHIRELLCRISPEELDVYQYYDLALILNLVGRDHLSTLNDFYYIYTQILINHGYSEEDITSSKYLFGMLLYLKDQDTSILYDLASNGHFDTSSFYKEFEQRINREKDFFQLRSQAFPKSSIEKALLDRTSAVFYENFQEILVNVYLYEVHHNSYDALYTAMKQYLEGEETGAVTSLSQNMLLLDWPEYRFSWVLKEAKEKILALGEAQDNNDYLRLHLSEYLEKYRCLGSFNLVSGIKNYLRLALKDDKRIDIASIASFWTKFFQRKDYSLLGLEYALPLFEEKGFIHWEDSVILITRVQEMSEKGYKGLLASYLMQHEPAFIKDILDKFRLKDLHIAWLKLKPEFINELPDSVYDMEMRDLFWYNRSDREIDINEIEDVLYSNKINRFKDDLRFAKMKVRVENSDKRRALLEKIGIKYRGYNDENRFSSDKDPEARYNQGILDNKNAFLIEEKSLQPKEVALLADGNHTALANPEIYKRFEVTQLQHQIKDILFNALKAKSPSSDYFNIHWLLPGTMIRVITDSGIEVNFQRLFCSFSAYLELSSLDTAPFNYCHRKPSNTY